MKNKIIDLHTHTNISDGVLTPIQLAERAVKMGIEVISITDHDSVGAYSEELLGFCKLQKIEIIPGIEFSTVDDNGFKYHVVGLFIDLNSSMLADTVERLKLKRLEILNKTIEKIGADNLSVDQSYLEGIKNTVTKAHISRSILKSKSNKEWLIKEFGHVPTEGELIEKFMLKGQKYYVDSNFEFTPKQAIDTIRASGGLSFLAHPSFYVEKGENINKLVEKFIQYGVDGIEVFSLTFDRSNNDKEVNLVEQFYKICEEKDLLMAGGSDFHTSSKDEIGNFVELGFIGTDIKFEENQLNKIRNRRNHL